MNKTKFLFITGFLFLLNVTLIKASVMAIDYGSEWYKVSLITPKIPLELVLNEESQRKTRSIISIVDDVRMFSNDAVSKFTKTPQQTFDYLKLLAGKKIDDEEVKFYKSIFNIEIIEDKSRNSILIKSGNETYTVEELISYQLSKAKLIAEKMSGKLYPVDKGIVTVPRFFNQYERLSIVNAAEIAGIKVLSVMNEDTAAAVNFAMTRNFDSQPKYYVFFDMGASSTTITLSSMKSIYNPNEKSKKSPEVEIIDFNFDKTLGGLAFDRELQLLVVDKIKKIAKVDNIQENARVMAKILVKVRKAKEILSANTETTIYFDSLINDQDFNIKVTREEFEKASENLLKRTDDVVTKFFKSIKIPKDLIDSIILVGGSTRVPMVQNVLKKHVGESKLANYVNSDEAIVMGSGFEAASLSREFKVRSLIVKDIHSSSDISYEYKLSDGKLVSGKLFNEKDPLTKEITINLKSLNDFDIAINYDKKNNEKQLIFKARISNIKEVIDNYAIKENKDPKITLKFSLAHSDIVFISEASVKAKIPVNHRETLLEKLLTLIKKPHWYKNRTVDKYKPESLPINAPKNFDVIKRNLPLNQMINKYDIYPLTGTVKKAAIDRKKAMDDIDKDRVEIDIQKNDLESLIYKGREMLNEQEKIENKDDIMLSDTEIKTFKEQLGELFEKLFEENQIAKIGLNEIKEKISSVKKIVDLVNDRREEITKRENSIKQFEKFMKETLKFYEAMIKISSDKEDENLNNNNNNSDNKSVDEDITEVGLEEEEDEMISDDTEYPEAEEVTDQEEVENVEETVPEVMNLEKKLSETVKKLCTDADNWLKDVVGKQKLLKNWDVPAVTSKEIEDKILEIYNAITDALGEVKKKEDEAIAAARAKKEAAKKETTASTETQDNQANDKKEESKTDDTTKEEPKTDDTVEQEANKDDDNDTLVNEGDSVKEEIIDSKIEKDTTSETENQNQKIKNDEL